MFGRRVSPQIVFLMSALLAALCGVGAYVALRSGHTLWGVLTGLLAVWFAVDAARSYRWTQASRRAQSGRDGPAGR